MENNPYACKGCTDFFVFSLPVSQKSNKKLCDRVTLNAG